MSDSPESESKPDEPKKAVEEESFPLFDPPDPEAEKEAYRRSFPL